MTIEEKNTMLRAALNEMHEIITNNDLGPFRDLETTYTRNASTVRAIAYVLAKVMRTELGGDIPPKTNPAPEAKPKNPPADKKLKMAIISMPRWAAIKYDVGVPGLPRLTARVKAVNVVDGKREETTSECEIFKGNELFGEMTVYAGKATAIRMLRGAMKAAMSRFGKRRRMTRNRQAREAAKKEGK